MIRRRVTSKSGGSACRRTTRAPVIKQLFQQGEESSAVRTNPLGKHAAVKSSHCLMLTSASPAFRLGLQTDAESDGLFACPKTWLPRTNSVLPLDASTSTCGRKPQILIALCTHGVRALRREIVGAV
eukprot:1297971-Rhodomonas_salina.2